MKLAKTSPALPVLRKKKNRKWLVWTVAVGTLALTAAVVWGVWLSGRVNLSPEEQELVDLINQQRRNNLIAEVKPNARLCEVARRHSQWMCDQQKREVPTVPVIEEYLTAVSYPYQGWGVLVDRVENRGPKWIMVSWLGKPNLGGEVKSFHHEEVGVCMLPDPSDPSVSYVTVVFGKR
ncbi:MAG: hypothetical protein AB7K24_24030 [Gemmataceae bacterium]